MLWDVLRRVFVLLAPFPPISMALTCSSTTCGGRMRLGDPPAGKAHPAAAAARLQTELVVQAAAAVRQDIPLSTPVPHTGLPSTCTAQCDEYPDVECGGTGVSPMPPVDGAAVRTQRKRFGLTACGSRAAFVSRRRRRHRRHPGAPRQSECLNAGCNTVTTASLGSLERGAWRLASALAILLTSGFQVSPVGATSDEVAALVSLAMSTSGDTWAVPWDFRSASPAPCSVTPWTGVTCGCSGACIVYDLHECVGVGQGGRCSG